ncbi:DUF1365 domain-containing protein [Celeribacter sp.]|uniref:DUF1365 domain-containing protein n=1 Tax=Celeribacter sp. TaxID=1890673 RepID=UPI003A8CA696
MKTAHIQGQTYHTRRGAIHNAFRYGVDFVLIDMEDMGLPPLLSRNRFNLWSVHDRRHGGPRGAGEGLAWFRRELASRGLPLEGVSLLLLTQPSFLGIHFNPVNFWIAQRGGKTVAFVAEVNNTFGHRHCYFCAHPDFRPISPTEQMTAEKIMHVSPFQDVDGLYRFTFDVNARAVTIRIQFENGGEGVLATLVGTRDVATTRSLAWAAIRRPFGAARVVALIYWQALKLKLKGAAFRPAPAPPEPLVSEGIELSQVDTKRSGADG